MKPRRWFQLQLSMLIALSFVAAGLLWVNMRNYFDYDSMINAEEFETHSGPPPIRNFQQWVPGWPVSALELSFISQRVRSGNSPPRHSWSLESRWRPSGLIVDVMVAVGCLIGTALLLEWLAWRRERS